MSALALDTHQRRLEEECCGCSRLTGSDATAAAHRSGFCCSPEVLLLNQLTGSATSVSGVCGNSPEVPLLFNLTGEVSAAGSPEVVLPLHSGSPEVGLPLQLTGSGVCCRLTGSTAHTPAHRKRCLPPELSQRPVLSGELQAHGARVEQQKPHGASKAAHAVLAPLSWGVRLMGGGRHWQGDLDLQIQTRRSGPRLPRFPFQERTVAWVGGVLALIGFQEEGDRGWGVAAPRGAPRARPGATLSS